MSRVEKQGENYRKREESKSFVQKLGKEKMERMKQALEREERKTKRIEKRII